MEQESKLPTHRALVLRAGRWLTNHVGCGVVLLEGSGGGSEIPDAIGWKYGYTSYLIECKCSRADFLRDKQKFCREHMGVGQYRYYLAPKGVIQADDLPPKWGLLELWSEMYSGSANFRVREVVKAEQQDAEAVYQQREIGMLVSALRKVKVGAFIVSEADAVEARVMAPLA